MLVALAVGCGLVLLVSALLSASESACLSISPAHLRAMEREGFEGAGALLAWRESPDEPASAALLVLNSLLNTLVGGGIVLGGAIQWGITGAVVSLPVAALIVVLVGELLPRLLARRRPVRLALSSAPALSRLSRIVRPLLAPYAGLEGIFDRSDSQDGSTREQRELREIADIGEEEGVLDRDEKILIERVFRLDEQSAWDVMTPRVEIFAWQDSLTLGEIVTELRKVPYSRVPVFGSSIDDVTGVLYVREAYQAFVAGRSDVPLSKLAREPLFVPGSVSLTRLLKDFQARRMHMGIVADEFGGTDGLVTLEDILEELVGEIEDETDVAKEPVRRISRSEVLADGQAELREINYILNVSLPQFEHRTLNGFLLEELGHVPEPGEVLMSNDTRIEVLDASETQLLTARIKRLGATRGDEAA